MAKLRHKTVKSFGGVGERGTLTDYDAPNAPVKDVHYDVKDLEVKSTTNLEEDDGSGGAAIVRCFEFGMNPESFARYTPSKQELFNFHLKGIEFMLWRDGLKIMTDVNPRVVFEDASYKIFVGAAPAKGHILYQRPQTLSELVHGRGTE